MEEHLPYQMFPNKLLMWRFLFNIISSRNAKAVKTTNSESLDS